MFYRFPLFVASGPLLEEMSVVSFLWATTYRKQPLNLSILVGRLLEVQFIVFIADTLSVFQLYHHGNVFFIRMQFS